MSKEFYNKVAQKFGAYNSKSNYINEYTEGKPDDIFKSKINEFGGADKTALDLGCADGIFTSEIAPVYREIVGVDQSAGMLAVAEEMHKDVVPKNITFRLCDAEDTGLPSNSFDTIFSRRGPTPFNELGRLLKVGGHFLEISIGENNGVELKNIFGRGQGFGLKANSIREDNENKLTKIGFKILYSKDFEYNSYFKTYADLELFLQGSPLIDDFDAKKDKLLLTKYAKQFQTEKGLVLRRHLFVLVAEKAK